MAKPYLTDSAYATIKDWIIHYHLKPGTSLRFEELAKALEMSQTPIREALNRLEQDRFVERRSRKGYIVRSLNLREVEDIYDLRMALEVLAAQQAATRITHRDIDRIANLLDRAQALIVAGDKTQTVELERSFHAIILEASDNQLLSEMGRGILDRIWMIQSINILTSNRIDIAHSQHLQIFDALKMGRPGKAGPLMKNHLISAKKFVISRMRDTDDVLSKLVSGFPEH